MTTVEDKSIYGQIKTKGEQLAELVKMAEDIQSNNDKNATEAYQRGFDDAHRISEEEYQRGLNDAWEVMKKIALGPEDGALTTHQLKEIFGTYFVSEIIRERPAQEVIDKIKAYEDEHSDCIEVGDEVVWKTDDITLIVTSTYEMGGFNWCDGVMQDGKVYHVLAENVHKTGKHYNIASILEEMRK